MAKGSNALYFHSSEECLISIVHIRNAKPGVPVVTLGRFANQ